MYISIRMWNALGVDISRFLFGEEALALVVTYVFLNVLKYSLQGTTQGNGLTGADMPVRFSM